MNLHTTTANMNKTELIKCLVSEKVSSVREYAKLIGKSPPWCFAYFKGRGISYKNDITAVIKFNKVKEEAYTKWVVSCGEDWDEVKNDDWVPYGTPNIEFGQSGSRRKVVYKEFKGKQYVTHVFIPDFVEDHQIAEIKCDREYKYVLVNDNDDYHHTDNLSSACDCLGINYQAAKDCLRDKSAKTRSGWVVKYTKDYYAL